MWRKVIFCDKHKIATFTKSLKHFGKSTSNMAKKNAYGYLQLPQEFMERTDWQLLSADNSKVEATMRHCGLSFRDIDKSGQPKIWELMSMCSSSRIFVHHVSMDEAGNTFRDFKELTQDHMTFLVTSELNFFKPLYDLSILNKPLVMKIEGGYIGNTSFNALTTVSLESSGTALLNNVNQVVYIDPVTRKPTQLPGWWKEKYAESAKNKSSLRLEKFERPPETGHGRIQVTWTFTDNYNHANWTSYARYALDIAHLCSKQGLLKHFAENIKNGISKIQLHYYGESLEGDFLDIYTWEDELNSKKVYFDICKEGTSIFQCIIYLF